MIDVCPIVLLYLSVTVSTYVMQVGCGEEEEHFCLAYENNQWVNLGRESLAGEVRRNSFPLSCLS